MESATKEVEVLTATPPAADALATRQNKTSAALIANRLLSGLPTVRALPSQRATHQPPSSDLVRQIHARARRRRAGPREVPPPSATGWAFLELRPQTSGIGSFWKVSSQDSSGYAFLLFEHYSCVGSWSYEGPSYLYVVLGGRPDYLGFVCGGQLITS
jgi:hypothetical protein